MTSEFDPTIPVAENVVRDLKVQLFKAQADLDDQQDRAIELGLRNTDLLHEVVRLREVLQAVTEVYEGLISSGDCGPKIDPDTDPLAIQARAALNLKGQA